MIDLINNSDDIPAPVSTDPIVAMIKDMALYDGEPPLMTLSMLISEVKMWRAKNEYDEKSKLTIKAAVYQKLKEGGAAIE